MGNSQINIVIAPNTLSGRGIFEEPVLANAIPHATAHMPLQVKYAKARPHERGRHDGRCQDVKMMAMIIGEYNSI